MHKVVVTSNRLCRGLWQDAEFSFFLGKIYGTDAAMQRCHARLAAMRSDSLHVRSFACLHTCKVACPQSWTSASQRRDRMLCRVFSKAGSLAFCRRASLHVCRAAWMASCRFVSTHIRGVVL